MNTKQFYFSQSAVFFGLLALAVLSATPARAQSRSLYDWAWVARLGATTVPGPGAPNFPPSFDQPESLAADAAGNVLIAGAYDPDVIFGGPSPRYQAATGPLGTIEGSYVAKYTSAGALAWTMDLTGNGDVRVSDLAVDAAGNSYVLGSYYQQLRINGVLATSATSNTPCFLAKISPAGTLLWATTVEPDVITGNRFTMQRLAVDALGNTAVQGEFEGQVSLNGATFTGAASKLHILVARYSALGVAQGAFAGYTNGSDQGRVLTGIALSPAGECYLSGRIFNTASIQFGTLPILTGPPSGGGSVYSAGFVVKHDASTIAAWQLVSSGASAQLFNDVAVGPQGRCYIVGTFRGGSMTLGGIALTTTNPAGASGYDILLAKLSPNGTVESLHGGGGTSRAWGLSLGPQGEPTIGTAGGLDWGNVLLPGPSSFASSAATGLLHFNAAGVPQRGWQAGGGFFTTALAVDGLNRPVLAGTYTGVFPAAFGTQQLTSPYSWNTLIARTGTTVLSTRQAAQVAGLEVFPNPARQLVEVRTAAAGAARVQLLDALGRIVRAQALNAEQTRMNLVGVAAGFYTLRVQQGGAVSFRHLVVEP
ncbi:MAG TPA: T9SS type A sorting domain-containing protein [Hymenobacter sp.]|jgi:hypothetical protein|uniref:T9SS type A sorting domain-containing protein n=1 Tax=Hymenobacter sp. TaxID=1898978 RepID=UPI002EDB26F5